MLLPTIIAAFAAVPFDERAGIVADEVARIETNTVYDSHGREILKQNIFQEATDSGYRVRAWRLVRGESQVPTTSPLIFQDGDVTRKIYFHTKAITHTQYDPETDERRVWPQCLRRPLTTPHRLMKPDETDLQVNDGR